MNENSNSNPNEENPAAQASSSSSDVRRFTPAPGDQNETFVPEAWLDELWSIVSRGVNAGSAGFGTDPASLYLECLIDVKKDLSRLIEDVARLPEVPGDDWVD